LDALTPVGRGIALLRDDCGSELTEYALVLSVFALVGLVAAQLLAVTANTAVETDQTNYTNAFVNGY
jgi:Flp pilus assembly pilin Flp